MCIFCDIVASKIDSYKIYEDNETFAFLDIKPSSPGHVLVIPKKHVKNIEEIDEQDLMTLIKTVKKVGLRVKEKLGVSAYNLVVNNGEVAGQQILHLHFHIVPRYAGDNLQLFPNGDYKEGEAEEIVNTLKF